MYIMAAVNVGCLCAVWGSLSGVCHTCVLPALACGFWAMRLSPLLVLCVCALGRVRVWSRFAAGVLVLVLCGHGPTSSPCWSHVYL